MREVINTPGALSSPLYSQAVKAGQHVYVSGLVGIDVSTGNLAGSTIQEQTRQALTNCEAILRAAGATLGDVVEVGVLLTNPTDFAGMNQEYATWFPAEPPTRYVAKLGVEIPNVLVSIRMTAFVASCRRCTRARSPWRSSAAGTPDYVGMAVTPGQTDSFGSLTNVPGIGHVAKLAPGRMGNDPSPGSLTVQGYAGFEL